MWNEDEVKGKAKRIKGKIKEQAGDVMNDPDLEIEGEAEQIEGHIQEKTGKIRRNIEDTVRENLRDQ